ncbi:MAG: hypothetical protein ACRCWJ_04160 [Casimicrobium sp.]
MNISSFLALLRVMFWLRAALSLVGLGGLTLLSSASLANPTALDTSYGGNAGVAKVGDFLQLNGQATAMQPDGKMLVVGNCPDGATVKVCLVRFNTNGGVDSSFGVAGYVQESFSILVSRSYMRTIAVLPDGKIIVAGYCFVNSDYRLGCAIRYNLDGSRDSTFSPDGQFGPSRLVVYAGTREASTQNEVYAMAIQADGKFLLGGFCVTTAFTTSMCLSRFLANGSIDTSFATGGLLKYTASDFQSYVEALAIQSDGKIITMGGCLASNGTVSYCIDRWNSSGNGDTSFGGVPNGTIRLSAAGSSSLNGRAIVVQPDDKILVARKCLAGIDLIPSACISRLNANGTPDASFVSGSQIITRFANDFPYGYANSMVLQGDGKLVLIGVAYDDNGINLWGVERYNDDGTRDQSFSGGGITLNPSGQYDGEPYNVRVQNDGKIVIGGSCFARDATFCIVRLTGGPNAYNKCSLDIDGDGYVLTTTDMLIVNRVAKGVSGSAVIGGIRFPAGATRTTWGDNTGRDVRKFLITQCSLKVSQ